MDFKQVIAQNTALALEKLGVTKSNDQISSCLEIPPDASLGDYAFPCFALSKELRRSPQSIAQDLYEYLSKLTDKSGVSRIEVQGAYLNFFIAKELIAAQILPQILSAKYLGQKSEQKDKVMVEYSQPNTHKAFHVGHIRCATLGDSLARILEWVGYKVIRSNYIGDEGTHVAKCLWYLQKFYKGPIPETNRGEFLGELYTKASNLTDLSLATKAPYPGVVCAKILRIKAHNQKLFLLSLDSGSNEVTAISADSRLKVGDLVPFAPNGVKLAGRNVKSNEAMGVICSEKDFEFSDKENSVILEANTKIGKEVAEIYRIPGVVDNSKSVLEVYADYDKEISEVLQKIEAGEGKIRALWQETKEWCMLEFREIYQWLNCKFDHYFFESEFGENSKQLVKQYQSKGVFTESHGAIGADLAKFGLGFCLLIKRDGTALYATRDLTLAQKKFEEFQIDRSIYVVDSAQTHHFRQVFKCLELMGYAQAKNCYHLGYAQVVRPDGKMSSRKGNVILFSELKQRLLSKINAEYLDKFKGVWPESELHETAQRIALATMRYGMLNQDTASQVVFDLDEWSSRTGNTGPYLLYAQTRTQSILRELGSFDQSKSDWSLLTDPSELEVISHLASYEGTVLKAAVDYAPVLICRFAYELAKRFNRMYLACPVIKAETQVLGYTRASLVQAVGLVLEHALGLLGINTVSRM